MNTRINLQPIAAPSILGLYAFAGSTLMVAANMAGWYGNSETALYLIPFTTVFGGIAQFAAGMWAYKARDAIATAMHGTWGSFWVGFGILEVLMATGTIPAPEGSSFPALGYWFIALSAITIMGTIAAAAKNLALTLTLGTLSLGSISAALAFLLGSAPGVGWGGGRRLRVYRRGDLRLVHGQCADVRRGLGKGGLACRCDRTRPKGSVGRPG
jgi:succinate-acetate transporter protein